MTLVAVRSGTGLIHMAEEDRSHYGIRVLNDRTKCGRRLLSAKWPISLRRVTTKQVCRVCINHLPEDQS